MRNFKGTLWICFLLVPVMLLPADNRLSTVNGTPKVGDILVIEAPESANYLHIDFPKPNIILKRSGVYNLRSVRGVEVEIIEVKEEKEGRILVKLQPTGEKKFFRHWRSVTADYHKAITSGELRKKNE